MQQPHFAWLKIQLKGHKNRAGITMHRPVYSNFVSASFQLVLIPSNHQPTGPVLLRYRNAVPVLAVRNSAEMRATRRTSGHTFGCTDLLRRWPQLTPAILGNSATNTPIPQRHLICTHRKLGASLRVSVPLYISKLNSAARVST